MKNIKFDVKVVRECLVNKGRVFTVRSWMDPAQESFVEVAEVGKCKKIRIAKISKMEDLALYVNLSGFNSIQDWWVKVSQFGACNGWLYLVVRC